MQHRSDNRIIALVCTAERAEHEKAACGSKGVELFLNLQAMMDGTNKWKESLVLSTPCLGFCEDGPVVSIPACRRLFIGAEPSDVGEMKKAMFACLEVDDEE